MVGIKSTERTVDHKGPPDWALLATVDFKTHQLNSHRILNLSKQGLQFAEQLPQLLRGMRAKDVAQSILDDAENVKPEVDADFPTLHAQAVMVLWGSLETTVFSTLSAWVLHRSRILQTPDWSSLKIAVGQYEGLDRTEQASYLVALMDQKLNTPPKPGVERFQNLLETIKLRVIISAELKKDLREIQQVRNLYAHKRGIVDARFRKSCPWLSFGVGHHFQVDGQMYERYDKAADSFVRSMVDAAIFFFEKESR